MSAGITIKQTHSDTPPNIYMWHLACALPWLAPQSFTRTRIFIKSVVRFLFHAEIFNLDFKCVPRRNPRPVERPLARKLQRKQLYLSSQLWHDANEKRDKCGTECSTAQMPRETFYGRVPEAGKSRSRSQPSILRPVVPTSGVTDFRVNKV